MKTKIKIKIKKRMNTLIEWLVNIFLMIVLGVQYYLLVVAIIFMFDTLLGLITIKKRKDKFSFKKFFVGLSVKIIFYTPAVVSLWVMDNFILNELILHYIPIENLVTKAGTVVLLGTELTSINKHIRFLRGKSFTETGSTLWKKIKEFASEFKIFDNIFKK